MNFPEKTRTGVTFFLIFLALFLCMALTARDDITLAGNEASRLAAVQSLVDEGTLQIDRSMFRTVDKARIDGHFYSGKPLLLTWWLGFVYWLIKIFSSLSFQNAYHAVIHLLNIFGTGSFTILLVFLFLHKLKCFHGALFLRLLIAAGMVWTTWIFSFGTALNSHTPAACIVFVLFCVLDQYRKKPHWGKALAAGLLAGLLFNVDIPTGGIFMAAGLVALFSETPSSRMKMTLWYGAGFAALVAVMGLMNYFAYGHVLPVYLIPGAYDYPGSLHTAGYGGLRKPLHVPAYFFHMTLGNRGFFSYMPVFLFIIPAVAMRHRLKDKTSIIFLATAIPIFLFYGTQTGDYGGWSYGFRFLIPLIPVFWWWMSGWFFKHYRSRWVLLFYLCLAWGFVTSLVGAYNPWPVVYEGASTHPGVVEEDVHCPFTANLLCMAFEEDPKSGLTRYLVERVYGPHLAYAYLKRAYRNMNREDLVKKAGFYSRLSEKPAGISGDTEDRYFQKVRMPPVHGKHAGKGPASCYRPASHAAG